MSDTAPPTAAPATTVWDRIVALNERLWTPAENGVSIVGDHAILLWQSFVWLFRRPFRARVFIEAMDYIGVQSLMIVSLIGLFVGMVFSLQLTSALRQFGTESFVGATLGISLCRELAPVFCSIVVAARAGAGMATELGSMRITEQIDALSTIAVSPVQYLISPRIVAGTLMTPLLTVLFIAIGMFGGFAVAVWLLNVDRGVFIENARWVVDADDVIQGIVKAVIFGMALTLIACYQGFNASGGAKGVGIGTTRAVVGSFVTILVLDYFITDIVLTVQGR